MHMTRALFIAAAAATAAASATFVATPTAEACGGFFCGNQPVDQQAERILFAVDEAAGTTTMIVEIRYNGAAEDFAWLLPLGALPDAESLDTFPQAALTALDANTGPQFAFPDDPECYESWGLDAAASGPPRAGGMEGGVDVLIRQAVGPFDLAVIESPDPSALVTWLRDNGFRVTSAMEPYIGLYTTEGNKILALRLQPGRDVADIEPIKIVLPGQAPTIPIRLTAVAAEPEMGIATFVLGDRRFGPAGEWTDVEIDDSDIVWRPYTWPMETNWTALVARAVDEVDGRGVVTEFAGATAPFAELARATTPSDPEQIRAQEALLELLDAHPYMTRMYTRLSPEEMTSDPVFRRTAGGDVDRTHMLSRFVEGRDLCIGDPYMPGMVDGTTPCDFASCGRGGLCRVATIDGGGDVAGCACVHGATARTTFDPRGRAIVSCIDQRLSFMNPGERDVPGGVILPDPCVGFDCGAGGTCVSMNLTPTCVCDEGLVAVGSVASDGSRLTECLRPNEPVPDEFYNQHLPDLAIEGGRPMIVLPGPATRLGGGGGCAVTPGDESAPLFAALGVLGLAGIVARRRRTR
jgi:MYXO-CTERM domain-containing protein